MGADHARRRTLKLISSLALAACCANAAVGMDYHVAPDGSDDHDGGEARPFQTVGRAAELARAGDTILLRAGIYAEQVLLSSSGEEGRPITLKSYPGERAVIQPGVEGSQPPGKGVLIQAREGYREPIGWIVVEALDIRYAYDGVKFYDTSLGKPTPSGVR